MSRPFKLAAAASAVALSFVFVTPAFAEPLVDTNLDAEIQSSETSQTLLQTQQVSADESDTMPGNPDAALPDKVASSIPDDATVVSENHAITANGKLKDLTTGKTVTDPELVGTKDEQPDPLAKTDGSSFIPVQAEEVKEKVKERDSNADAENVAKTESNSVNATGTVRTVALGNNEYGAHWGTYKGSAAFFDASNNVFVSNAKGVIDVSEWQHTIDWAAAKAAGVEGAIIRLSYGWGNGFDKQALRNISECKRLGIPFGVYLYSYAYDADGAAGEGQGTVDLLRQAGVSPNDLSYPVYYDLEQWSWTGHVPPTDPSVYDDIVNAWYRQLRNAGYTNLSVYSYTTYLNGPLNSGNIHAKTRWVAQYSGYMSYADWPAADRGWQYTASGSINGIDGTVDLNAFGTGTTGTSTVNGKWVEKNGKKYWYENGAMVRSKEIYDPESGAWYWLDADGTMARNKDVYMTAGKKWVRYDSDGHMIKGEDYRYGGWYYFDPITGAMAKGMRYVKSSGGKWVYYDWTTGQMHHGETYVNYDKEHTGWYLFDSVTGAMFHGFTYFAKGDKWVYYDATTGIMAKGYVKVNGAWYYFDKTTGKMAHGVAWVADQDAWIYFGPITGRHAGTGEYQDWKSASSGTYPKLSSYSNLNLQIRLNDQVVLVRSGSKVIYAMTASTGKNSSTPKGDFTIGTRGKSFYDKTAKRGGNYWLQFKGDYRFQTVPTDSKGNYIESEAKQLGQAVTSGSVYLTVPDAQWLFEQLPANTPVHIA
ncbi:1,4-beta-N-acetylmuramidase [Bifidobacterium callitrichidarum]|uniref:1,4-beta-N-acetylmuramidase n=1 Tax=Bifidobacterium callitrichidarum TaxID=2052941 RepID=A0A2U2N9X8_9BIFI|nr:1,4-beta-N-acetylmuramidase [Bifidobacterium callitrichidarum]